MRRLIIQADVNGTRLDLPHVVQRSALGSCDCRCAGRRIPPRARPGYIRGREKTARIPPGYKGPAMRPRAPSDPPYVCRM